MFFASRRLKQLEDALAKLRRDMEDRDLDWVEMRARCKRLLDRTEKAAARLNPEIPSEEHAHANGEGATQGTTTGRALTARQMEVQQQILRRRAGA